MGEKFFLYPCVRCGTCCLMETCPNGMLIYGVPKHARCPGLKFTGDQAECDAVRVCKEAGLPGVEKGFGIGVGCCMKGRVFKDGKKYDIASLPTETKVRVARQLRESYVGHLAPLPVQARV